MKIIAHIYTDFKTKFGLPRQSGLVDEIVGKIVFQKEFQNPEAFRGLENFSHIWLIWQFSESQRERWSPTVRPPLLGGNKRVGVFATRSPFRPNPLGLSCVKLEKVEFTDDEGPVLWVRGSDLMNGTPIYDIKPYLPYCDSKPDATGGFTENLTKRHVEVIAPDDILEAMPAHKRAELIGALQQDPRPSYQNDPERIYGFEFADFEVGFKVSDNLLTIVKVQPIN